MPSRPARARPPSKARLVFAANVKNARREQDLLQKDLHERTGLSLAYLSDVERGKANISIDNADLIARALGRPLHQLLNPCQQQLQTD
ncbi:helix-turn-helix domain-containing protein, partial [Xanthomonas phaseoli]